MLIATAGHHVGGLRLVGHMCTDSPTHEKTTLGGEPALAWTCACTDGVETNRLATLHGNRGYVIFLVSNAQNDNAEDRRIFESIRGSFRFMNNWS